MKDNIPGSRLVSTLIFNRRQPETFDQVGFYAAALARSIGMREPSVSCRATEEGETIVAIYEPDEPRGEDPVESAIRFHEDMLTALRANQRID